MAGMVMSGKVGSMRAAMLLLALFGLQLAQAFYLPGVAPRAFKDGEEVNLKVQTLVSTETPLQFDYYQLPFCRPKQVVDLPENLGEALTGERGRSAERCRAGAGAVTARTGGTLSTGAAGSCASAARCALRWRRVAGRPSWPVCAKGHAAPRPQKPLCFRSKQGCFLGCLPICDEGISRTSTNVVAAATSRASSVKACS